jgi:hypothetical protein
MMNLLTKLMYEERELRELGARKRGIESKLSKLPRGNPYRNLLEADPVHQLYQMQFEKVERLKASVRSAVA